MAPHPCLVASPAPQVSSTTPFRVGQWVRLWVRKPGNQSLPGRRLQAAQPAVPQTRGWARKLAQQGDGYSATEDAPPPFTIPLIYSDPYLQAAVEAAAEAETIAAAAAYAAGPEPTEADALSADPAAAAAAEEAAAAALNPLGLEQPMLAAARYSAWAMASEIAAGDFPQELLDEMMAGRNVTSGGDEGGRAPALAVLGSLDYYLYGGWRGRRSAAAAPASAVARHPACPPPACTPCCRRQPRCGQRRQLQ